MTWGLAVSAVLAAVVLGYVLAPLLRSDAAERERASHAAGETIDLRSEKDAILASLRDLEDDRQTGKVEEADYTTLQARLRARAIEIMKRLDELDERHRADNVAPYPSDGRRRGRET